MPRRPHLINEVEKTQKAIDAELASGENTKPSRANLLSAKLTSQLALIERADAQKRDAALLELAALKKELAAFKALNVSPEQVSAMREENGRMRDDLAMRQINERNDRAAIASQQKEIEALKKNLDEEVLCGLTAKEWLQFRKTYPTQDAMFDWLRQSRKKVGRDDKAVNYCTLRLRVEFDLTPEVLEEMFRAEDVRRHRENVERANEKLIQEAHDANLHQPQGIAGDWR
jgi:hypothetical protein